MSRIVKCQDNFENLSVISVSKKNVHILGKVWIS